MIFLSITSATLIVLYHSLLSTVGAFTTDVLCHTSQRTRHLSAAGPLYSVSSHSDSSNNTPSRRDVFQSGITFGSLVAATLTAQVPNESAAMAKNVKSRTIGYDIQHTEVEWSKLLTKQQFFILREGGTESPYSSILEGEERAGLCEYRRLSTVT